MPVCNFFLDEATLEKILQRLENLENKVSQIYAGHDRLALPARDYQKKGKICLLYNLSLGRS